MREQYTENMLKTKSGFTIVELLIVIVVIAILAAISIVAYNGIQQRARDSAASQLAAQASRKVLAYQAVNSSYPPDLTAAEITDTTNLQYSVNNSANPATFCITASSGSSSYYVNQSSSTPIKGGCAGHGQGGAAAITNLHPNPGAVTTAGYGAWAGNTGNTNSNATVAAGWSASGSAFRSTWSAVTSNTGDLQVYLNSNSSLTAGSTYTVRYRLMANQNGSVSAPGVYSSAGTNSLIARSHTSDITLTAGTPVEIWVTFQGDATAITSGFRIIQNPRSNVAGNSYELSEAVVYAGARTSPIGFYWGNSPSWIWNGTQNASTSTGPAL